MQSNKHVIIFSHGFGVRKDARGLFTDIADEFHDVGKVMFDYNVFEENNNTIIVRPLDEQAEVLREVLLETKKIYPGAVIDIVAHSQGGVVVALSKPAGVRKTILLAPPVDMNFDRMVGMFKSRPGTLIDMNGVSRLSRKDGSITLVPASYFDGRKNIKPMELYEELSNTTELIIVKASEDEVLGDTDFSKLSRVKVLNIDGDHNFTGEARKKLLEVIGGIVSA
ncbi:MAG: hypothetical protein WC835_01535 [Candidatus Paceibacterota bacterium]|jgi:hypothetical protein